MISFRNRIFPAVLLGACLTLAGGALGPASAATPHEDQPTIPCPPPPTCNGWQFTDFVPVGGAVFVPANPNGINVILGSAGPDNIVAGGGNDIICAMAGNDVVDGQAGNDKIIGGAGNDTLVGGTGNDVISGEGGKDLIYGNDGNDCGIGGTENDELRGNNGTDTLYGNTGDDLFNCGLGVDDFADGGPALADGWLPPWPHGCENFVNIA